MSRRGDAPPRTHPGLALADEALGSLQSRVVALHSPDHREIERIAALMEKYRGTPMDLADASLVAAAETLGERRILTLDSDFRIYRKIDGAHFEIVP